MARDDLNWISLVDFSPGIYSKYGASSTLGKDGAARIDDGTQDTRYTFGCYGDPDGGLRPLPGLIRSYVKDTHDVTEHAHHVRPHHTYPTSSAIGAPPGAGAVNGLTFRQHPTTRALGTSDGGRRAKIGVIDMLVETAEPVEWSTFWREDSWFGDVPGYVEAGYKDREGASRPDQVHFITAFRQDPVPLSEDPDSMFPRWGRLRSQWRRFMLGHYDPSIGNDLYDYEWIQCSHADLAEEDSWWIVDQSNLPHYIEIGYYPLNDQRIPVWPGNAVPPPPTPPSIMSYNIPMHMTNMWGAGAKNHNGWGRGNLSRGRAITSVPNSEEVTLDALQDPGSNVVVACFQSYTSLGSPAGMVEEYLANFWTYIGGDNPPDGILGNGQSIVLPHWDSDFLAIQSSWWTTITLPEFLTEHQDQFVGIIRDYGAYHGVFGNMRGSAIHPRSTYRFTWSNAMRVLWRPPTAGAIANDGIEAQYADMWFWSKRADETWGGVSSSYLGTPPGTTNLVTPGSVKTYPVAPGPMVPGNQIGEISCLFSWQNTLVFVPATGEGSIIKGSLVTSAVIRTGTLIPTGGVASIPVTLPTGVAYGTTEGVAFWSGEKADIISPQLDGDFWISDDANECRGPDGYRHTAEASMGRFGYLYPFVYAPNNWVMDTRTGGWFRLVNPDDPNPYAYMHYMANESGEMYAARGCYDDVNTDVLGLFSSQHRATRFRWVSQPLMSTINREQTVERLNLVAQGQGVVTINLVGIDGTEQTETAVIDSVRSAEQVVIPTSMHSSDLTVIITSEGVDGGEAPTVHALHLGTRDGRQQTR
jgi:hypothetical protein